MLVASILSTSVTGDFKPGDFQTCLGNVGKLRPDGPDGVIKATRAPCMKYGGHCNLVKCQAAAPVVDVSHSQQAYGHSTSTTADFASMKTVHDILSNPKTYHGSVMFHRHGTTEFSQSLLEDYGCYRNPPCITGAFRINATFSVEGKNTGAEYTNANSEGLNTYPYEGPENKDGTTKYMFLGDENNPQRHMDVAGVIENTIVGNALQKGGITFGSMRSSAFDRCYLTAKKVKDLTRTTVDLVPEWRMTTAFGTDHKYYNASIQLKDGTFMHLKDQEWEGGGPGGKIKNAYSQHGIRKVVTEAIAESVSSDKPSYLNGHGSGPHKAIGLNQERGVSTIVVGIDADKRLASHSDRDISDKTLSTPSMDYNTYGVQLAPRAWTAFAAWANLSSTYNGTNRIANDLFDLDTDKDFRVNETEFNTTLATVPESWRKGLFDALDNEGATFAEDEVMCKKIGCNKTAGVWRPLDSNWANVDNYDPRWCNSCDLWRKPVPIRGDGFISIGYVQEQRDFASDDYYPYGLRTIKAVAVEAPAKYSDLVNLYAPEARLVADAKDWRNVDIRMSVGKLKNISDVATKDQLKALFGDCSASRKPTDVAINVMWDALTTEDCPASWQGDFLAAKDAQRPNGVAWPPKKTDTIPGRGSGTDMMIGDVWPSAFDLPKTTGKYVNGKLRLATYQYCTRAGLSIDHVLGTMCAVKVQKVKDAMGTKCSDMKNKYRDADCCGNPDYPFFPAE